MGTRDPEGWNHTDTFDEVIAWLVRCKLEALTRDIPPHKVAWMFRMKYGRYPTSKEAKVASRTKKMHLASLAAP
jgi:hypothetical protein